MFDPATPLSETAIVSDFITDGIRKLARVTMAPKMEALIPPEYRHRVVWFERDPKPYADDFKSTRGEIGWRYEPETQ